jgi:hypothetical protein
METIKTMMWNEMTYLQPVNAFVTTEILEEKEVVRVTKDPKIEAFDESTFAKVLNTDFSNGIIEVKVLSRLLNTAPDFARGFIGVAFRIDESNSIFECIYIRPTNGRCDDQIRRNGSTQYFSYPDYKFDRLRSEFPRKYESYADMGLDEWIKIKIIVNNYKAVLFLNDSKYPVLIVNDLKHGSDISGGIGFWIDIGTDGYFTDLRVINE